MNRIFKLLPAAVSVVMLTACGSSIWNGGDLERWVRDQAVKQGCGRSSIELEDWYREESGGNVWHGTCLRQGSSDRADFAIDVDKVWKPSKTGG